MSSASSDPFRVRGQQLAHATLLTRNDPEYASATALTAIHSAIAYQDAVQSQLAGTKRTGDSHLEAVRSLEKVCKKYKVATDGVKHLRALIAAKSKVSYGDHLTTLDEALKLAFTAERFQTWAVTQLNAGSAKETK